MSAAPPRTRPSASPELVARPWVPAVVGRRVPRWLPRPGHRLTTLRAVGRALARESARAAAAGAALLLLVVLPVALVSTSCRGREPSKLLVARRAVHELATTTYRAWRAHQPERLCPASIDELAPYSEHRIDDPYGTPYRIVCATPGIVIVSAGGDAVPNTRDDVRSDR